jgi:hypothetical protein
VAEFTKGPLKTHGWTSHGLVIATESGLYLGYAQGYPDPKEDQVSEAVAAANATLWAAAPELYEALEMYSPETKHDRPLVAWIDHRAAKMRAALKKARGESR